MDKKFIDQAYDIVINNLTDEKFGAQKLASLLNLSTVQTLRKIRAATGKSVNQYIRELRLKEAAKLIKETDFTIAEVSYKVGFGSYPYFCTAFRKRYGITPGEYKTQNKSLSELESEKVKKRSRSVTSWKKAFYLISVMMVIGIGYSLLNKTSSKNISKPNSIAVLPFRDMSPEDRQWFCDGVSDNILTYLSQIKDLTVISFTSSSTFRETDKTIPQIAKELGVSYILEGSATVYEDKIKINAQLINANDEHVWTEEYTVSFEDVIGTQQNIAREISEKLEITLSPIEALALEKYPTENMEAYHLFLKGLWVNKSQAKKDMELSIELNKQAIVLDSSFAEAYAEAANSYYLLSHRYASSIDPSDAREKAAYYANKALQIDSNTYRGWTVKADLISYIDWDRSDMYYEKAISINPNDANTRINYSINFCHGPKPNKTMFLEQTKIAYELDPLSIAGNANYMDALIRNNKLEEAEIHFQKSKFLFNDYGKGFWKQRIEANKIKDCKIAIPMTQALIDTEPNNPIYYNMMAIEYERVLNDNINALKYSKQAYDLDSSFIDKYVYYLIRIKKYKEAKELMTSVNYQSIVSRHDQLVQLFNYFYSKNDYLNAQEVLKDSSFNNQYWRPILIYAQLGNRQKVDSMNRKYPWGTGRIGDWHARRAILQAVLKDSDSMYFYLEKLKCNYKWVRIVNSRSEFNPYRKEERFKAFLKENYLPVLLE